MPGLTNSVREQLGHMLRNEVQLVKSKAAKEAAKQWAEAEKIVAEQLGYSSATIRIEHIQNQIEGLQAELRELEATMHEKAHPASVKDYREVGIDVSPDQHGRIYAKPVVFDHQITTVWDCLVLKYLNQRVPFFQMYFTLSQLEHTVRRELLLCGNFEEARSLYQRFHEKIGLAIGADLPGVLQEIQNLPSLEIGNATSG